MAFLREYEKTGLPKNEYVTAPGFSQCYVRVWDRYIEGARRRTLDFANIIAKPAGKGAFSKLIERLHKRDIALYVECVLTPRFEQKLLRMGFKQNMAVSSFPSFYLLKDMRLDAWKKKDP